MSGKRVEQITPTGTKLKVVWDQFEKDGGIDGSFLVIVASIKAIESKPEEEQTDQLRNLLKRLYRLALSFIETFFG